MIKKCQRMLFEGDEIKKRMDVVGEEGTSTADFLIYLKAEFLDSVYLQQNAFDVADAANTLERQCNTMLKVNKVLDKKFELTNKDEARNLFFELTALFKNWNSSPWESVDFEKYEARITEFLGE